MTLEQEAAQRKLLDRASVAFNDLRKVLEDIDGCDEDVALAVDMQREIRHALCQTELPVAQVVGGVPVSMDTQDVDDDITPVELSCPHCHKPGGLTRYYEDICNRRVVHGLKSLFDSTEVYLEVDGYYETDGCDENAENPRLCCELCGEECTIPESMDVEFV